MVPSGAAGVPLAERRRRRSSLTHCRPVSRQTAERGVCDRRLLRQDEQRAEEGLQEGLLLRDLSAG